MSRCARIRKRFVEYLYDELDSLQRQEVEGHVKGCPDCSMVLGQMRATLGLLEKRSRPEPTEEFWESYWERLSERMEGELITHPKQRIWAKILDRLRIGYVPVPQFAWALLALFIGIAVGKFLFGGRDTDTPVTQYAEMPHAPYESVEQVNYKAEQYLSRSKILLLRMVNMDLSDMSAAKVDVSQEKKMSEELIQTAAFLRDHLSYKGGQRLKELMNDLEPILLEIANMAEEENIESVEMLWGNMDKSILLKINIYEMSRSSLQRPI